jgi:hypothetical protein
MTTDARKRAEESVATRFTRTMNAATSPWGVACDLTAASAIAAVPAVLLVRQVMAGELATPLGITLIVLAVGPVGLAIGASISLRGAREGVVEWLASRPFPVDNMNSLLVGISDSFEVVFEGAPPSRDELQPLLDRVCDDTLCARVEPEQRRVEVKIGVPDDKRLPLRCYHQRYARFRRLIDEVLVPLGRERPIASVRVI